MNQQMQRGNRRRQASQGGSSFATSSMELVEEYPISSTVLAFGVGLGIGVLVGQTIAGALRSEPDPSSRLESLTQQVCDAVRKSVPEAIGRYLPR